MKRAFTLVEVLIVVAILGILAAIVVPQFCSHSQEANAAAARDNLRILRQQIGLYAAQHSDIPPGYPDGNISANPTSPIFFSQMLKATNITGQYADPGTPGYSFGPYLSDVPLNTFNSSKTVKMIGNADSIPAEATGTFGWIYKPAARDIRLDWPGTDKKGVRYYDY